MTNPTQSTEVTILPAQDAAADVAAAARNLGLKAVRAWVPDEKQKRSNGAERASRSREKSKQGGVSQLSVSLPTALHPALKALAARTKAGEPLASVLNELLSQVGMPVSAVAPAVAPGAAIAPRKRLSAWRRWLLRWLLPADSREWLN